MGKPGNSHHSNQKSGPASLAKRVNSKERTEKPEISSVKKTVFTFIFYSVLILVVVGVEVSLRTANYGVDTRVFFQPKYKPDIYMENLFLSDKYFPKESRLSQNDRVLAAVRNVFPVEKASGTLRGFFIGESSVQGFPFESNQTFSKMTELALKEGAKYERVEIMNLGVSAMTSYYIRDVALKVLKYKPDFILIYAGHNEYYGNVSYTTGGNRFSKNLYLFLKEVKVFQWLFDILSPKKGNDDSDTLMEKQFKNHKVLKDRRIDRQVADDFIRNIETIVRVYSARKIPVIIVEPVCNLLDMPPFAGEKDTKFKSFINKYRETIKSKDAKKIQEFYTTRLRFKTYDTNANIVYLDAISRSLLNGRPDLKSFILAKDMDAVPFRVRSDLTEALKKYCQHENKANKYLYFIPLSTILAKDYGPNIFSNRIFLDQLHFNQRGHRVISRIVSNKVAEIFRFNEEQKKRVNTFLDDDSKIDQAIHYLPAYNIASDQSISSLVNAPPFSEMLIPYTMDTSDDFKPRDSSDQGLVELMGRLSQELHDYSVKNEFIIKYYLDQNDLRTAGEYAEAYVHVYPGSFKTYLYLARYSQLKGDIKKVKENYIMAYLLSEKKPEIYQEMKEYFAAIHRSYIFHRIEREYGKPINE